MGELLALVIPYNTFKEKIAIVNNNYSKHTTIEVDDNHVYIFKR